MESYCVKWYHLTTFKLKCDFHFYENCILSDNFRLRKSDSRKHGYQLVWKAPKVSVKGLQTIFFFQTLKTWNELLREIVHPTFIDSFKNKLDGAWKY